jgi:hypothetical protein
LCLDCLCATTQATEWAVVRKPQIEPALGRVLEFWTTRERDGTSRFSGKVYDEENVVTAYVPDDHFPTYIKKPLEVDSPLLIKWIRIEEPHTIYCSSNYLKFALPVYASSYLKVSDSSDEYWLGWVDTRMNP